MIDRPGPTALTRRAVLRGAAVAGAAALMRPATGLAVDAANAGDAAAAGGTFGMHLGSLPGGETSPIAPPRTFSMVGVGWAGPARARIELRTRPTGGSGWSRWLPASVGGHGPDRAAGGEERFGEPIWTGRASDVQLRSFGPAAGVRLHFVGADAAGGVSAGAASAHAAQSLPLAQPILDAGAGQPPIIARAAWARGSAPPRHVPEYGTVKLAFVHHSESANGYGPAQVPAILRSIFVYHRHVRGYWDIGYNFAIDDFGRVWEARAGGIDHAVIGAQAGGYNAESTGIVILGSFMSVVPPPAALDALARLLAWKLSLHGVPALGRVPVQVSADGASYTPFGAGAHVSLPRIAGHRDGDQTSCPGDALYARLPALRPRAAALAGTPARMNIAAPAAPVSAGAPVTVTGRLSDLPTGGPIAGAPVEIQQIAPRGGESTIATLTTAADGTWSYAASPAQNTLLRALHRPGPATVSDVVVLAVAPAVTLTLASTTPLVVTGTVAPAGPRVTVDLYRVRAGGRRPLVRSRRLAAAGGSFHARIKAPEAGRYVLIARTTASARFAAAASPPVEFAV
jgi:N-acetylmuramoyl-L-alanine amidase